jgi:hypothetical protein
MAGILIFSQHPAKIKPTQMSAARASDVCCSTGIWQKKGIFSAGRTSLIFPASADLEIDGALNLFSGTNGGTYAYTGTISGEGWFLFPNVHGQRDGIPLGSSIKVLKTVPCILQKFNIVATLRTAYY